MTPKISVCIPTYNYARYISFTIQSILSQKFTGFELIIVDDGSEDGTEEAVRRFESDKRISFEKNDRNLGLVANWNKCLARAKGEYVKFVFADDMLASDEALGRMAGIMDSDRSVSLVASARHLIDSESRFVGLASHFPANSISDGSEVISRCLREGKNLIGEPTVVMFRRSDAARGFDERFHQIVDLEMWFHLLQKGRFAFIGEPLSSFRIHPSQKSKYNFAVMRHLDDKYLLLKRYLRTPYTQIDPVNRFYMSYSYLYAFCKCAKNGILTKEEARRRIGFLCSYPYYYACYPAFKLLRLFFKARRQIRKRVNGE